jgi:hypothetical protein
LGSGDEPLAVLLKPAAALTGALKEIAMKHKKTVTDAVRAANQENAESSTGPQTERGKSNSSHNALRHGILAKRVVLETHGERAEFRKLFQRCNHEYRPKGLQEKFHVEDITCLLWKLQISLGREMRELSLRQDVRGQVDGVFHRELKLPINDWDLPIDRGWDCERLVVRAIAGKDLSNSSGSRGPAVVKNQIVNAFQNSGNHTSQEVGHLEVEAVLGSALEKMTRYQSTLRRDLYRAIEMLRAAQAERRKRRKRRKSRKRREREE